MPVRTALIPVALSLSLATACATSQSTETDPGTLIAPTIGAGKFAITNSYASIGVAVPVSQDSAYQILKRVYLLLEIPVAQESDVDYSVGNDDLKVRRKMAGLNMETVLDCGAKLDQPNAENWDIWMNLFSSVVPDGAGGSKVYTRIQAMGHDPSRAGSHWIACATKSNLEEKIGTAVKTAALAN